MNLQSLKISDVKFSLGILVKTLRKGEGLSQDELAQKLNLTRGTIKNIENGKNITIDTILLIFQYFGLLESFNGFLLGHLDNLKENSINLYE